MRRGGFPEWMRSRGKFGGQHKLPRMDDSGELTRAIARWLDQHGFLAGPEKEVQSVSLEVDS